MNPNNGIVVVAGGTGRVGYYVVQELLKEGFQVRLITRNRRSSEETFKDTLTKMESVFECDLFQETRQQKSKLDSNKEVKSILDLAFEPSRKGEKVQAFVSALGTNLKTQDDSKIVEETSIKLLVGLCNKHKVKQFVLVSSCLITRPFHPISVLINTFARNALAHKVGAENLLRESGLNYIIVRPGGLLGDQTKQTQPTGYTIAQGDRKSGKITRSTVGKIVVQSMLDPNLPNKVTFECFSTRPQLAEEFIPFNGKELKADNESSIIRVSHAAAGNTYRLVLLSLLAVSAAAVYKLFF